MDSIDENSLGTAAIDLNVPPEPRAPAPGAAPTFDFTTQVLAWGLLALGAFWRLFGLKYPMAFAFDEYHFVRNARNYITHQADWNDHPPLGKLLIVPTIQLFGDNGLGWRLPSVLLGLVVIALVGLIAGKVFNDKRVGLLAAVFVAIDGFFISYARIALLDTPLTAFMYGALALMLWGRSLTWFAGAAVCMGLAVATKWTGVCIILVAPFLLMRHRRAPWHVLWMFGVSSLVYVVVVTAALHITQQPISIAGLMGSNLSLLKHHTAFTVWDNAASSKWYTWPFLTRPILLSYAETDSGMVRAATSLGNVFLWFSVTVAVAGTLVVAGRSVWRAGVARRFRDVPARDQRGLFIIATMIALMLPFMLTNRQSYIFHYLGAYGLGLGLLASWVINLGQRSSRAILSYMAVATAVSIVYVPIWINAAVSKAGFLARLPFPGWR